MFFGAGRGSRTHDLQFTKLLLYQLSYSGDSPEGLKDYTLFTLEIQLAFLLVHLAPVLALLELSACGLWQLQTLASYLLS